MTHFANYLTTYLTTEIILYTGAIGLLVIGLLGLLVLKNIFRLLLSLVIFESGANLFLVLSGFRANGIAPILTSTQENMSQLVMNDPVPQALVLTAIVIGVGIQALALSLIIKIYQRYRTLDMNEIHRKLEQDIAGISQSTPLASQEQPLYLYQKNSLVQNNEGEK
ncbi:MAG: NADH-quinone oxidoreductase subunit K [Gammaproteobacteria bacterium]|nr:NADH-quinone oxidoreductase subunit K [Gammaproteobacteria bacterium]